jgi:light-regulated signal transduction histidine kinase (bacteriophytochrome)
MQTGDSTVGASSGVSFAEYSRAILNILDDFTAERSRLNQTQTAVLNILEDFAAEKEMLEKTKKAVLNILDDFVAEKTRLEMTQKAVLNILEDFEEEKTKVESVNDELRREVAERRAAEGALTEKGVALARSNADLEQFAYVASHDLQEPLRMVSSYMQLLSSRYEDNLDSQAQKYIGYAVEGATRMQSLIAGLLEYSRVGRYNEEPVAVPAQIALERAVYNLRAVIDESGASVTLGRLPHVWGQQSQLVQVFQNLIGNAIKFRSPDDPPRVDIWSERRGQEHVFAVQDNGIGVEPRYADKIFVIFQRLHTRSEYPGTGIGLAICKKVIERSGGRIWVEPGERRGSRFCFTLPTAGEAQ